jgi:2'-5' RNA ligase
MSHRLFIGIRPPIPVREALIDTMEALEGARWQDDDQLHLTLRFIG